MKLYYLVSSLPKGSDVVGLTVSDFKAAHKLLSSSLKMWSPLVEGVVIKLVELDDGNNTVIEMAARDELGLLRMEEMREIVV
jgi:hypothetical protein